jgi:hypothetical protein
VPGGARSNVQTNEDGLAEQVQWPRRAAGGNGGQALLAGSAHGGDQIGERGAGLPLS